jgi:hypothetical protein
MRGPTQTFRYSLAGHGSDPPVLPDLMSSSDENEVLFVLTRTIPSVGLPSGSVLASSNSTRASPMNGWNTEGTVLRSAFLARKSSFRTSIWLLICAFEMFCALVL